jgi:HEAT repeat protein
LKKRLPIGTPNAEQFSALLADLDSEEFAVRTKATRELEELGEAARPGLRKLLDNSPSPEARRRAERILAKLDGMPQQLRAVRSVEVLDHIGTAEARQLLTNLAAGVPDARLTREAKAALGRLARP